MDTAPPLIDLAIARLRLRLAAPGTTAVPRALPGSLWRAALGAQLRAQACSRGCAVEAACAQPLHCAYGRCFEAGTWQADPRDAGIATSNEPPKAFTLLSLPGGRRAEALHLELTLFGEGIALADPLVEALQCAAMQGLGDAALRLRPLGVECWDWCFGDWSAWRPGVELPRRVPVPPPPTSDRVRLALLSNLQLVERGRPLRETQLTAQLLLAGLLRRVALLAWQHQGWRGAGWPAGLKAGLDTAQAARLTLDPRELRWQGGARHSQRQGRAVPTAGLVGALSLQGADLAAWWPWLVLGQWTHLGKKATQGLGAYRLLWPD